MSIRVCDIMHNGVITCSCEESLRNVAAMLSDNQFRSVVVVNENGEVWGLITYMELLAYFQEDAGVIQACQVMMPYRIEVDPQWPIEKAIELMNKLKYYHLIIVDPHVGTRWPVGMLTSFDIVRYMSHLESGHFASFLKLHRQESAGH
jgi:predicted transcriptional regulator